MLLFRCQLFYRVFCVASFVGLASISHGAANLPRLEAARVLYAQAGKSVEAQKAFEAIAADDPNNADAHYFLGLLALRRDETTNAVTYLEKAVQLAPNDSENHRALGDAYGRSAQKASVFSKLGWAKKCLVEYQRAVALDPNNIEAHSCLFDYYRSAPTMIGGGAEKASAQANTIKKLDPARGRLAFATLYLGEKQPDKALAEFEAVIRTYPDDYATLYQVGRLAALTGQFVDHGILALRRCLELTPPAGANTPSHAVAQWRLGNLLEKRSDVTGARTAYEMALKLDPTFASARESLNKLKKR